MLSFKGIWQHETLKRHWLYYLAIHARYTMLIQDVQVATNMSQEHYNLAFAALRQFELENDV